ncbi:MAG: hypothetical protein H7844_06090 [Nitrospirae bacterium YQR-1]
MEESTKKLLIVIGKGVLFGYMASLAIFFLMFPLGLLFYVAKINWIVLFLGSGIAVMRKILVLIHIICILIGVGFSIWKSYYKKGILIQR